MLIQWREERWGMVLSANSLGLNYRMTDIHAALGISQMKRLDGYIKRRRNLAYRYKELLMNFPIKFQQMNIDESALHLYPIILSSSSDRSKIYKEMHKNKIGVNVHYIPIHTQPFYKKWDLVRVTFQHQKSIIQGLEYTMYGSLTFKEQDRVGNALEESIKSL